jgi:threonine/homoserine/homoserine lactone efflux protein
VLELLLPSLLSFALASLIIEAIPGPNQTYLAALTLQHGLRAGLAAVAGIALGLSIYGLAATLGVATLIDQSPLLYGILRWTGILYFLWLAWDNWRGEEANAEQAAQEGEAERTGFRRGLITNLLNPKAAIFYVALLPGYIMPGGGPVLWQTFLLSAVFVTVATFTHLVVVFAASRLQTYLTDPEWRQPVRRGLALLLAAVAIWFAFSTAR